MDAILSGKLFLDVYSSERSFLLIQRGKSASHDIMRLYDLQDRRAFKHSTVPFLIIPGPPRAGVISSLYIDPTSRFMLSAAGTRGWNGTSTEVLVGYEISVTEG